MNKREYYDLLVKSAYDGTFPGYDKILKSCVYRGANNTKCAVGVLIPDDYPLSLDINTGGLDVLSYDLVKNILPEGMMIEDLREIQDCHDLLAEETVWQPDQFVKALNELSCFHEFAIE